MNEFKQVYQNAMEDMKEYHIDVASCIDNGRHRKRIIRQIRRVTTSTFSVLCIFCVCAVGAVSAGGYFQNITKVNNDAYQSVSVVDMENKPDKAQASGALAGARVAPLPGDTQPEVKQQLREENDTFTEYSSIIEFEENHNMIFPQPTVLSEYPIVSTHVTASHNWATVRYEMEDKVLVLERRDYADTLEDQSKERVEYELEKVTTDVIEQEENQYHSAATIGTYEINIDFYGFEEEEVNRILESIDFSEYQYLEEDK